jgi:uncharacterized protein YdhG (YjbR/CyaY superfamily)
MRKDEPAEIDRYIAGFPPDVAFVLERLRETIHKAAPGATEGFDYDMPVFRYDGHHIVFVGAWKKHVGLYPVYPQAAELEAELAPLRSGQDTVKLVYSKPIPDPLVTRLVKARIKALKAKRKG